MSVVGIVSGFAGFLDLLVWSVTVLQGDLYLFCARSYRVF